MGTYLQETRSVYENYFVAIDGEGFAGDEYGLLDSSFDPYPRLYTGKRLTSMECLDWLWGLAKYVGYAKFVIYGGRYDFDNWVRDLPDLAAIKEYVDGNMVRIGPYGIVWQKGYKFEIRKIVSEKPFRYDRIAVTDPCLGNRVDKIGVTVWDVQPFWQSKFSEALKDTLGDRAIDTSLIEAGKTARGTFTHDNIEWVSRYNKAECHNLAWMMVELDKWFESVGVKPDAYNGPGAAAKAVLRQYKPQEHAGRRMRRNRPKDYVFPGWSGGDALRAARSAYAGGRNQLLKLGYKPGTSWSYDINSAYPHATTMLPCLSHGRWKRTTEFVPGAFGLYLVRYKASREMPFYPFFWRTDKGTIIYPSDFNDRWMYDCELEAGLAIDPNGVCIKEGRIWIPEICENPNPFWWVRLLSSDRLLFKQRGMKGPSVALKLPLNSLYGSIAQARGSLGFAQAPWTQQILWAGWITAYTRAKLTLAANCAPNEIYHMATDGLICGVQLALPIGNGLGEWEEDVLTDLSLVQYGVYFSKEKNRWRSFDLSTDDVEQFVERIHAAWKTKWRSLDVRQRLFVTSSLVANGQRQFNEWCGWEDAQRTLNLDIDTPFEMGAVKSLDRLYEVHDMTRHHQWALGPSALYEPKWGSGSGFPWEDRDALDDAFEVATAAA